MPKGKKHTPEQIAAALDGGEAAQAVCRELNISEATMYRWKQQYGALELEEVKELKTLRSRLLFKAPTPSVLKQGDSLGAKRAYNRSSGRIGVADILRQCSVRVGGELTTS